MNDSTVYGLHRTVALIIFAAPICVGTVANYNANSVLVKDYKYWMWYGISFIGYKFLPIRRTNLTGRHVEL